MRSFADRPHRTVCKHMQVYVVTRLQRNIYVQRGGGNYRRQNGVTVTPRISSSSSSSESSSWHVNNEEFITCKNVDAAQNVAIQLK